MTTFTIPSRRSRRPRRSRRSRRSRRRGDVDQVRAAPDSTEQRGAVTPINPHNHGGAVLFEVSFRSSLSGSALQLLRSQLAMTTHVDHKLPADPNSPGVARLDRDSALLLERGLGDDEWVLQARTWGRPSASTVREWHLLVGEVVRQLDPAIVLPEPMPADPLPVTVRPVGRAANRRWAAARRRLVGLA